MEQIYRPKRTEKADLLEMPQMMAIEIKVDRIDLNNQKETDLEDMVIWVQVLGLPLMEMLPYQRDRAKLVRDAITGFNDAESADDLTKDDVLLYPSPSQPVRLSKKSDPLIPGQPAMNSSENVRQRRKSGTNETIKTSIKRKSSVNESNWSSRDKDSKSDENKNPDKVPSRISSKTFSFREDTKQSPDEGIDGVKEMNQIDEGNDQFSRKKKLFTQLISSSLIDEPEGVPFKSDICILLPTKSVSDALYRMEQSPLTLYLLRTTPCSRLVGKVTIKLNYCFQNSAVEAAQIKGGVVIHGVEDKFKVCKENNISIGCLLGSVKLICYGSYGVTEIKSPTGDLMVGELKAYRSSFHQNSVMKDDETSRKNAYGFKPIGTKSSPGIERKCDNNQQTDNSMFDFVECFYTPEEISENSSFI